MPVLLHQSTNSVHTPQQAGHTIFQNAQQGWCGWHKIDRNLTSDAKYKSILVHEKNKSIFTRVEIDLIVKWLWYFIKHYENSDEVEFSMMLLNYYLNEPDQSLHFGQLEERTRSKLLEYLAKSFFVNGDMLFESCFEGMTMANVTTSINESWHRATKKHSSGPRPNHDLEESSKRITNITERNEKKKARKTAFDANAVQAKSSDREINLRELTDYCNEKLFEQYQQRDHHFSYCFSLLQLVQQIFEPW